jgi:integrase
METRNGKYREMIWFGKRLIKSPYFKNKTDAKNWKAKKLSERNLLQIHGDEYRPEAKQTFLDFSDAWINNQIKPFKSPSTYREYESVLRVHLKPFFGIMLLKDIKIKHAENFVVNLINKGIKPKGVQDKVTILKQIMNEAERREILIKNPLRHFKSPKVPERDFAYWSQEEISKFLLHIKNHPLCSFFITALYTGMRKGEIAALKWDCVQWDQNLLTVRATLDRYGYRESTKSGRIRHVPINDFLKSVLRRLYSERKDSDFVFHYKGKCIDTNHAYRIFRALQEQAGISKVIRMHDTRHTFASQYMMKELGNLFDVTQILGHVDSKTTQRYAHLSPNHISKKTMNLKFGMESELFLNFTPILPPTDNDNASKGNLLLMRNG